MKINLTYEMKKRFEDRVKILRKASKKGVIDHLDLVTIAMDSLHLLVDNIESEEDFLQLEESFEALLKLSVLDVIK